jgi:DNA repair protein RadA/Sms
MTEVENPSAAFLDERQAGRPGSAVAAVMEGTRPLLVEVQALVSPAPPFGSPRRSTTGLDRHRCHLVLAVLEKRAGLNLATQDVYANVPGGVRITEPAGDLGAALAIASSLKDRPVRGETAFFGEIGLTGEVRSVNQPQRRLQEAFRLGFRRCMAPRGVRRGGAQSGEVIEVRDIAEAFEAGLD